MTIADSDSCGRVHADTCHLFPQTPIGHIESTASSSQDPHMMECSCLVLVTGPDCRVGLGSSSTRNWTMAMGLTTQTTQTVGNGTVLPPKTHHFKFTIVAPTKYFSSDCTMTWSVRTLCSFRRTFTSRCQICNRTNICWVAIENPRMSLRIWCYFTAIQRILIRSQIWKREVEECVKLHNLHIHHVMICWDLRYLIRAKVAETLKWNCGPGNNPSKTKRFGFLVRSGTELNRTAGRNPDRWRVTRTYCLHFTCPD